MKFPNVISVKALEKYKVLVVFDDGVSGTLDLHSLAGKGVFNYCDEDDNFNKVYVHPEWHCITWPGEFDIDTINAYRYFSGRIFEL